MRTGIEIKVATIAPNNPLRTPTKAPSPSATPEGRCLVRSRVASAPPPRTQAQQMQLPALMKGSEDNKPKNIPPASAGCMKSNLGGGAPGVVGPGAGSCSTGVP